jgi:hypothetical protein
MKQKAILIVALLALVSMMIAPVCAETINGSLGGSATSTSVEIAPYQSVGGGAYFQILRVKNIEYSIATKALVKFDSPTRHATFSAGAPSGEAVTFVGKLTDNTGAQIVTGTIGYMRYFDALGDELAGYQWIVFDDNWNLTGLTGDKIIWLDYNKTALHDIQYTNYASVSYPTNNGNMFFSMTVVGVSEGTYQRTIQETNYVEYSFTKPSGIGITGTVSKVVGGTTYSNRVFIFNATSGEGITNDLTMTSITLPLYTTAQSLTISMNTPTGLWYNSSLLFTTAAPTVTPTPYQIIDPIPPGYTRTWFINSDGQTGGSIQGSFVDLYDVQNTSWKNTTLSMSVNGNLAYIDTLPNHTINAYGHAVGYDSDTRLGLPAADTVYELVLWTGLLSPGTGNVNLNIIVSAQQTGMAISDVSLSIVQPSGATEGGRTGSIGTYVAVVPNLSYIRVTASKTGYGTVTSSITTTDFGPDTLRISLPRLIVTPTITATPLPGQATVAPTLDTRSTTQKDADMMNQVRDSGPMLIGLAILATVFGLMKLMTKK